VANVAPALQTAGGRRASRSPLALERVAGHRLFGNKLRKRARVGSHRGDADAHVRKTECLVSFGEAAVDRGKPRKDGIHIAKPEDDHRKTGEALELGTDNVVPGNHADAQHTVEDAFVIDDKARARIEKLTSQHHRTPAEETGARDPDEGIFDRRLDQNDERSTEGETNRPDEEKNEPATRRAVHDRGHGKIIQRPFARTLTV
jgi:hypothetical protein